MRKTLCGLAAGVASLLCAGSAQAEHYYIGQVLLMGNSYCPKGTAEASGTILDVTSNYVLFSLLGNAFGGDGRVTFALPDLRGRVPNGFGQGPGLAYYRLGERDGSETLKLDWAQLPEHTHKAWARGVDAPPNIDDPTDASPARFPNGQPIYNNTIAPNVGMAGDTAVLEPAGGGEPFDILSPYLTLRYCIVTEGVYPPRD